MTNDGKVTAQAGRVIEMYLAGARPIDIARKLGVTRQAIHSHLHKNGNLVAEKKTVLIDAVVDNWIEEKRFRLEKIRKVYDDLEAIALERAYSVTETTQAGEDVTVTTRRVDGALLQAMRGLLSDASDQLGQTPRAPVVVNNDNRTQILVRQVAGADVLELG